MSSPERRALRKIRNLAAKAYLRPMRSTFEFALPVKADHEIKHDGYRMMLLRENDRVGLISKGGNDWTKRFPCIVEPALRIRTKQFI